MSNQVKKEVKLDKPSSELIAKHLRLWEDNPLSKKYPLQERALNFLFRDACPSHDDLKQVIIKVSALNDFYSTNIFDTYSVAKHIVSVKNIEKRLEGGDLTVVDEIAQVPNRPRYYSFASKYCSHHQPISFPIYDFYVEAVLKHFRKTDKKFERFKNEELKSYARFVEIIKKFKEHYHISEEYSLRDIDIYLWQTGKANFPRKYYSKKNNS